MLAQLNTLGICLLFSEQPKPLMDEFALAEQASAKAIYMEMTIRVALNEDCELVENNFGDLMEKGVKGFENLRKETAVINSKKVRNIVSDMKIFQ